MLCISVQTRPCFVGPNHDPNLEVRTVCRLIDQKHLFFDKPPNVVIITYIQGSQTRTTPHINRNERRQCPRYFSRPALTLNRLSKTWSSNLSFGVNVNVTFYKENCSGSHSLISMFTQLSIIQECVYL